MAKPDTNAFASELEALLADDPNGIERDMMITKLLSEAHAIKSEMDRGVSVREYALMSKEYTSLVMAARIVPEIWADKQPIH